MFSKLYEIYTKSGQGGSAEYLYPSLYYRMQKREKTRCLTMKLCGIDQRIAWDKLEEHLVMRQLPGIATAIFCGFRLVVISSIFVYPWPTINIHA